MRKRIEVRTPGIERPRASRAYVWLAAAGLAGLVAIALGLFFVMQRSQYWTGGSKAIALMIVLGVIFTAILGGVLMALAFYSSRRGYDEPPSYENPDE